MYVDKKAESAQGPDRQGGALITEEMLEAGSNRLSDLYGSVSTAYLVSEVYLAMRQACSSENRGKP